jgi:L-aspartate oxidase
VIYFFKGGMEMEVQTDYLVIGSGIAGLSFALYASRYGKVAIVTKKEKIEGATNYAQGGIASVIDPTDDFEYHVRDTLQAGDGLCHEDVVRMVVQEGPTVIRELISWGVSFSKDEYTNSLDLGREGGHSKRRIVHAEDRTGHEIERVLLDKMEENNNIT